MNIHQHGSNGLTMSPEVLQIPAPYLLFLGDVEEPAFAKTAFGLRDWATPRCVGELDFQGAKLTTGLNSLSAAQAVARGARSLVIGVANPGGVVAESWRPALVEAMRAGLDIVSGMHGRLEEDQQLAAAAIETGPRLINVRIPPAKIPVGTGARRSGKRLLTVGTDCASGKNIRPWRSLTSSGSDRSQ